MRPRKKYANQHTFVRNCGKLAYKISRLYCQRKKYAGGYKSGILGKIGVIFNNMNPYPSTIYV
jgi:hypothetical protein